jgi:hypothetical protein
VVVIATKKLGINPYFHKKVKSVYFSKRNRRKTSHSTTMWYDGLKAGCFMNCCRETVEMAVIPDNRRGACPEPVEGTPEDARKDGQIHGRSRQLVKCPG